MTYRLLVTCMFALPGCASLSHGSPSAAATAEPSWLDDIAKGRVSRAEAIRHLGEPQRVSSLEEDPHGEEGDRGGTPQGAAHQLFWEEARRLPLSGPVVGTVRGDTLLSLLLAPEEQDQERVARALGATFAPVHYAVCAHPAGGADAVVLRRVREPRPRPAGWSELRDETRGVAISLDGVGRVEWVSWHPGAEPLSPGAACPTPDGRTGEIPLTHHRPRTTRPADGARR